MKKFRDLAESVRGEISEQNDTTEKVEMTQSQLHFIHYACEEILDYIDQGGEVEEWYQVKVAKSFSEFESLHSFIEGEKRRKGMVKEEVVTEGAPIVVMPRADRLKKPEPIKVRYQGDIVPPTQPPSTEKRGVKGRPGQRPMPTYEEVEQITEGDDYSVTVTHVKADKSSTKHDYHIKNANDARHAKNIAINRHTDKVGIKPGEQIHAGSFETRKLAKEEVVAEGSEREMDLDWHYKNIMQTKGLSDKAKKQTTDIYNKLKKKKQQGVAEEVEQIDELSKKTLGSYIKSASHDVAAKAAATRQHAVDAHRKMADQDFTGGRESMRKSDKSFSDSWRRRNNMAKAVDRLTKENIEQIDEKNVPTSPEKWAQAKAQAKAKFDVYPSAYANGWAAKKYKEMGGGWKSVNEAEQQTEPFYKSSRKAQIVKDAAKKKKESADTFQKDPIISKTEVKM